MQSERYFIKISIYIKKNKKIQMKLIQIRLDQSHTNRML